MFSEDVFTREEAIKSHQTDHFLTALLAAAFLVALLGAAFLATFLVAAFLGAFTTFLGALLGAAFLAATFLGAAVLARAIKTNRKGEEMFWRE